MQRLFDVLREHEKTARLVCRVVSVIAFVVGAIGVLLDYWAVAAVALVVLAITEVWIPRKL